MFTKILGYVMADIISRISRMLLLLCMFILLTLGNAHAGVCDQFGLDASDSYYIPAPITKFCVLAGSDPPKKWVPERGLGNGLTNLQSGLQVVTGKASSLCPSPKIGDGAKGCPNFQFPNCATIPSDDPAAQTAQAKSGACVNTPAAIDETANASENDVDETYEDITQDDIKCAVQLDISTTYTSDTADQSVCYGGMQSFAR
jgi:hypothetical protein